MEMIRKGVNGILVYCRDLHKSARWYSQLGFTIGEHAFDHFVDLEVDGNYVLHLVKKDDFTPLAPPAFTFDTPDIEATFERLKENGVDIIGGLNRHSNHSEFSFRDPDGNTLMFTKWD